MITMIKGPEAANNNSKRAGVDNNQFARVLRLIWSCSSSLNFRLIFWLILQNLEGIIVNKNPQFITNRRIKAAFKGVLGADNELSAIIQIKMIIGVCPKKQLIC